MQQVKDTVKIIFFIVWTLVGVALLVFMYKSYDMMGNLGGPRGGAGSMMYQQNSVSLQRGDGSGGVMQGPQGSAGQSGPQNQTQPLTGKIQN